MSSAASVGVYWASRSNNAIAALYFFAIGIMPPSSFRVWFAPPW